jgi:hypothetical protein
VTLRLGCLISGGGRTVLNLQETIQRGEVPAEIAHHPTSVSLELFQGLAHPFELLGMGVAANL